ncbi:transposase [Mesorhizobium sp.]|uniref:transposase n=1 Tax=Mesorhizobium sp. TaxID=1871066 RepID=UPI0025E92938|nr:transposase [Mesorhizobium sp.]
MADEANIASDWRVAIERHLGLINQVNEAPTVVEADIAVHALQDTAIRGLMTLPGIDVTVAASLAAAIGDTRRFSDPQSLVAYLGLYAERAAVR